MYSFTFWLILALLTLSGLLATTLSYNKTAYANWFIPGLLIIGNIQILLWFWVMNGKVIDVDDKKQVLMLNLFWDIVISVCSSVLPVLIYDIKLNWTTLAGITLVLAGVLLLKSSGN